MTQLYRYHTNYISSYLLYLIGLYFTLLSYNSFFEVIRIAAPNPKKTNGPFSGFVLTGALGFITITHHFAAAPPAPF